MANNNNINIVFTPNAGSQSDFLSSTAKEVLIAGSAGSAKSVGLILYPLRYINNPNFRGLILRKTMPEIKRSLIPESEKFYPGFNATYNTQDKQWTFPSGAIVEFGYLDSDSDVEIYKSAQYSYIAFDEATHFSEKQYTYMYSRLRCSDSSLPLCIRAATNPDGPDHHLYKRYQPWLDNKYKIKAKSGQTLYYTYEQDLEEIHTEKPKDIVSFSRQFFFARTIENIHLSQDYINGLSLIIDPVERARLRDGLWVGAGKKTYFKRHHFNHIKTAPQNENKRSIRYWDRAATDDGDWTVGLLLSEINNKYIIEDVKRFRGKPAEVEINILNTAMNDGLEVMIGIEQDPGSAGVFEVQYYLNKLAGYSVIINKVNIRKELRARLVSSMSEQGYVSVVEANWNDIFFNELESFPEGRNDDQVDALSGAFNKIYSFINDQKENTKQAPRRQAETIKEAIVENPFPDSEIEDLINEYKGKRRFD